MQEEQLLYKKKLLLEAEAYNGASYPICLSNRARGLFDNRLWQETTVSLWSSMIIEAVHG